MKSFAILLFGAAVLWTAIFFGFQALIGSGANENPMTLAIASGGLAGALMSLYSASRSSNETRASRLSSVRPYLHIVEGAEPFTLEFRPDKVFWNLERLIETVTIENKGKGPAVNLRFEVKILNEVYSYEYRDSLLAKRFGAERLQKDGSTYIHLKSPLANGKPVWLPSTNKERKAPPKPGKVGVFGEPIYESYSDVEIREDLYLPSSFDAEGKLASLLEPGAACHLNIPASILWTVWQLAIVSAENPSDIQKSPIRNITLRCTIRFQSIEGEKRAVTFVLTFRANERQSSVEDALGQFRCTVVGKRTLHSLSFKPSL